MKCKISIIILISIASCGQSSSNKKLSVQLNDKALALLMTNEDSITETKALMLLDSAILLNKNNYSAYSNKINILLKMHQADSALDIIKKINVMTVRSDFLILEGLIYEKEYKNVREARKYYDKALLLLDSICQSNPDNKGFAITRASTILLAKGKLQGIKAYDSIVNKYNGDSSIIELKDQFYNFNRDQYLKNLW